ncbi:ECF transporter S component [Melissococcus plutonius]|uniref:ECF transporter S component n=1 Tax=Melissococcus plutonius TaxID=33970 RepID=UPI000669CC16|nr:putative membrane protein [Melissococcus plutonius]
MMKKTSSIHSIALIAVFIALTFLGTMIKIPLPTGEFVHLGNIVVLLAILFIGYLKGALAGGIGFALFDLFNGYAATAPYFIVESFVVGDAASLVVLLFNNNLNHLWKVTLVACSAGIAKIMMTQIKNTIVLLLSGANLKSAFVGAAIMLPATIINAVITVIVVSIIYFPLKKAIHASTK